MQSKKIKQNKKSPELTEKEETEKKKKCESYNIGTSLLIKTYFFSWCWRAGTTTINEVPVLWIINTTTRDMLCFQVEYFKALYEH